MKKLRVTLNGKVYEVMVEVLEDDEAHYPGAVVHPPMMPSLAPPPRAAQPPKAASGGTNAILAPITGTVTKLLVGEGDQVKENQPLVILDAMKMDTYINSPRSAAIGSIHCRVGEGVKVGQRLITLQ